MKKSIFVATMLSLFCIERWNYVRGMETEAPNSLTDQLNEIFNKLKTELADVANKHSPMQPEDIKKYQKNLDDGVGLINQNLPENKQLGKLQLALEIGSGSTQARKNANQNSDKLNEYYKTIETAISHKKDTDSIADSLETMLGNSDDDEKSGKDNPLNEAIEAIRSGNIEKLKELTSSIKTLHFGYTAGKGLGTAKVSGVIGNSELLKNLGINPDTFKDLRGDQWRRIAAMIMSEEVLKLLPLPLVTDTNGKIIQLFDEKYQFKNQDNFFGDLTDPFIKKCEEKCKLTEFELGTIIKLFKIMLMSKQFETCPIDLPLNSQEESIVNSIEASLKDTLDDACIPEMFRGPKIGEAISLFILRERLQGVYDNGLNKLSEVLQDEMSRYNPYASSYSPVVSGTMLANHLASIAKMNEVANLFKNNCKDISQYESKLAELPGDKSLDDFVASAIKFIEVLTDDKTWEEKDHAAWNRFVDHLNEEHEKDVAKLRKKKELSPEEKATLKKITAKYDIRAYLGDMFNYSNERRNELKDKARKLEILDGTKFVLDLEKEIVRAVAFNKSKVEDKEGAFKRDQLLSRLTKLKGKGSQIKSLLNCYCRSAQFLDSFDLNAFKAKFEVGAENEIVKVIESKGLNANEFKLKAENWMDTSKVHLDAYEFFKLLKNLIDELCSGLERTRTINVANYREYYDFRKGDKETEALKAVFEQRKQNRTRMNDILNSLPKYAKDILQPLLEKVTKLDSDKSYSISVGELRQAMDTLELKKSLFKDVYEFIDNKENYEESNKILQRVLTTKIDISELENKINGMKKVVKTAGEKYAESFRNMAFSIILKNLKPEESNHPLQVLSTPIYRFLTGAFTKDELHKSSNQIRNKFQSELTKLKNESKDAENASRIYYNNIVKLCNKIQSVDNVLNNGICDVEITKETEKFKKLLNAMIPDDTSIRTGDILNNNLDFLKIFRQHGKNFADLTRIAKEILDLGSKSEDLKEKHEFSKLKDIQIEILDKIKKLQNEMDNKTRTFISTTLWKSKKIEKLTPPDTFGTLGWVKVINTLKNIPDGTEGYQLDLSTIDRMVKFTDELKKKLNIDQLNTPTDLENCQDIEEKLNDLKQMEGELEYCDLADKLADADLTRVTDITTLSLCKKGHSMSVIEVLDQLQQTYMPKNKRDLTNKRATNILREHEHQSIESGLLANAESNIPKIFIKDHSQNWVEQAQNSLDSILNPAL